MLKSHEKFYSENGKRLLLVADDEFVNREILRNVLMDDYELLFAENGREALEAVQSSKDVLSLVLLDLKMPDMSGTEMLQAMRSDPDLANIPVIVLTSDQDAEVESLTIGANDFICKPYPQASVILARIQRAIELHEDRLIISSTERDELTGLYNREFFYRYAEQYDNHHKGVSMDALIVDINRFHHMNERFGTAYGDEVLRRVGDKLLDAVREVGGIVCRREADTFLAYCPTNQDYENILAKAAVGLIDSESDDARTWLRMGVYEDVDKALDIERRFDRAQMAADTVKGNFVQRIAYYDIALHEKELYAEHLIEDFPKAIKEGQFVVYYQPIFDVQPEIPVLVSAEALVRWQHPTLGMISPGVFIPLFEDNGLIQRLDIYVWRAAAAQIKAWKERFNFVVPVSVNVSRIDMYDPHLGSILVGVLEEFGLGTEEFLLEITESAYTQDSAQIIETVNNLRNLGFQIEMDDFGTGYSSLNMISELPLDALKLDMQFIRSAFEPGGDTRMIEIIIDIADYLSVPVIAEGVETEEQLFVLREMGCDRVQGYFFSPPVPAEKYESFIAENNETQGVAPVGLVPSREIAPRRSEGAFGDIKQALLSGFEAIFYVDIESDHFVEFTSRGKPENLQIEDSGPNFFEDVQRLILSSVHPDDEMRMQLSMQKETLLLQLVGHDPFYMTYRLVKDGAPVYYCIKSIKANTHDDHHIGIGVSNIDAQIRQAFADSAAQGGTDALAKN